MYDMPCSVTVANGDGIGEDIVSAALKIMKEAGAQIVPEHIEVGEAKYKRGYQAGMSDSDIQTIERNPVFLKGPITTPQGSGYRSINVAIRKALGLYANVRRCRAYTPYVHATVPNIDVVIVRENEEDLYTGLEYRQTFDSYKAIKTITKFNSSRIAKYAFEYARANNRRSIACCAKDNIMKLTDGNFCQCFRDVALEYPDIDSHHYNVDIAAGWLASKPERFDVILTENLYGDILSDIAAEGSGSIGFCSGANMGSTHAMFEAVHGSAPSMAKDTANPSALILASAEMLAYIGQSEVANTIYNAWLCTIESGVHTQDIYGANSKKKVGTKDFASAVIDNLGKQPSSLKPSSFASRKISVTMPEWKSDEHKTLVGVDVYVDWAEGSDELADILTEAKGERIALRSLMARGISVWPHQPRLPVEKTDCYRCIFANSAVGEPLAHRDINDLLVKLDSAGLDVVSIEKLYSFGEKPGFTALSD